MALQSSPSEYLTTFVIILVGSLLIALYHETRQPTGKQLDWRWGIIYIVGVLLGLILIALTRVVQVIGLDPRTWDAERFMDLFQRAFERRLDYLVGSVAIIVLALLWLFLIRRFRRRNSNGM